MALGGFFGGETKIIDEKTGTCHSPGVFAKFTTYGLLKNYIRESFDIPLIYALFDNKGCLRVDDEKFDNPPFIILNVDGGVFRRFIIQVR